MDPNTKQLICVAIVSLAGATLGSYVGLMLFFWTVTR